MEVATVYAGRRAAASVCGAGTLAGEVSTGLRDKPIQRLTMIEPAAGPTTPPQTKEASQERKGSPADGLVVLLHASNNHGKNTTQSRVHHGSLENSSNASTLLQVSNDVAYSGGSMFFPASKRLQSVPEFLQNGLYRLTTTHPTRNMSETIN